MLRKTVIVILLFLAVVLLAIADRSGRLRSDSLPMNLPKVQDQTASAGDRSMLVTDIDFYKEDKASPSESPLPQPADEKKSSDREETGPVITAAAYLVGNIETGQVYMSRNKSAVLPVASMSKLVTAIVATDAMAPDSVVKVSEANASVVADSSRIGAGEKFAMKEMLYPLLLNSSNIAAEALASTSDRIKFLESMSSYAWEIGMPKTFFADPSGLSPLNISTAEDFFALARYLYRFRPDILAVTRLRSVSSATTSDHGYHEFSNIHPFVTYAGFIGGKTGHTDAAKDTMLTMVNVSGTPVAIVVLSSDNRRLDTEILLGQVKGMI